MSRILIWRKPVPGSDIDIFEQVETGRLYYSAVQRNNVHEINWGNKVWYQGICSEIDTPENELTYGTDETPEEINNNYDLIVYPMANFFSVRYCSDTTELVNAFSGIRIPVYIIACGAQAESCDRLDDLICRIGEPAKRFIDAIYKTGGEFALRGYFSKEFFDRLGYPSAAVTGCPSLFQLGPDLKVYKRQDERVIPLINGRIENFEEILRSIPESIFLAQDTFFDCLFDPAYFDSPSLKKDVLFSCWHSAYQAELLGQGRIRMFPSINRWYHYIRNSGCNYSFGSKIHGSIMPVLAGIPSTVLYLDSRMQEIAEFFEIPSMPMEQGCKYSVDDLLSAYEKADFSAFNEHFPDRYQAFERFLQEHGIAKKVNRDNQFISKEKPPDIDRTSYNTEGFRQYAEKLNKKKIILSMGRLAVRIKNFGK